MAIPNEDMTLFCCSSPDLWAERGSNSLLPATLVGGGITLGLGDGLFGLSVTWGGMPVGENKMQNVTLSMPSRFLPFEFSLSLRNRRKTFILDLVEYRMKHNTQVRHYLNMNQ